MGDHLSAKAELQSRAGALAGGGVLRAGGYQEDRFARLCLRVNLYFGFEVHASFFSSHAWENNAALQYYASSCLMFILQASILHPLLAFGYSLIPPVSFHC